MAKERKDLKNFNSSSYLGTGIWEIIFLSALLIGLAVSAWFLWKYYEDKKEHSKKEASFSYDKDF